MAFQPIATVIRELHLSVVLARRKRKRREAECDVTAAAGTHHHGRRRWGRRCQDAAVADEYGYVKPSEFDAIPAVLPVKQLRENTITELSVTNCTLGVDGGIMLAALLATNTYPLPA